MRRFSFILSPVVKFPWQILMYICAIGAIVGAAFRNIHAVLPSLVGAAIFFLFYSMKRFSYILVTDRIIRVRMGVFAYGEIPFSNIVHVETVIHKAIHGIGVKMCGKDEVGVVTAAGEVVRIQLRQTGSLRIFGFLTTRFSALRLSPEKQDEFLAMVKERVGSP